MLLFWQEGRERQWCSRNLVTASTMEMISAIRSQCLAQLRASGFINSRHTEREVPVTFYFKTIILNTKYASESRIQI
jgi:hypothetical protein